MSNNPATAWRAEWDTINSKTGIPTIQEGTLDTHPRTGYCMLKIEGRTHHFNPVELTADFDMSDYRFEGYGFTREEALMRLAARMHKSSARLIDRAATLSRQADVCLEEIK